MTLKEIRAEYGVSQQRAAAAAGMPLRTYIRYEMNENYGDPLKRRMMVELIKEKCQINETQGVIPVKTIIEKTASIINEYFPKSVESCYLFGSYAKGYALPVSDINILLSSSLLDEEMKELERKLNEALHKNISLMSIEEASGKVELLKEVLKIGIRII